MCACPTLCDPIPGILQARTFIEDPKAAIRKILELINKFDKVAGYKLNTQKPVAFPYTDNERAERKIQKQFHLPSHQKE